MNIAPLYCWCTMERNTGGPCIFNRRKQVPVRIRPLTHFHTTLLFIGCLFTFVESFCPSRFVVGWKSARRKNHKNGLHHLAVGNAETNTNDYNIRTEKSDYVDFPAPLNPAQRFLRAATFWSAALPLVASYYGLSAEIKLRQMILNECTSEDEVQALWDELHVEGANKLASTITSLKGFYVKTAQIIASRQDLFPKQYTDALQGFTDNMDPMPASLVKAVIEQELLHRSESFQDVFTEFDETPLGSASIAQVHRAVLSPKYGGPQEVAVKVQRPSIEPKLLGDIANLKSIAKSLEKALPLDYYKVFCELESQLADEFDFVAEAVSMERIYNIVSDNDSKPSVIVIPRPISGLVSRRVLVMEYLKGVPLSRAREEMLRRGIDPSSPESKLFGRKLLSTLTEAFGKCILEKAFFHADPHPGNIFVLDNGNIGLIDFGQVKQISGRKRETLAKVMVALDDRKSDANPEDLAIIGNLAIELGVELKEDAKPEAAAAIAMWLFDGTVESLPGGYDKGELSPNSPVKELSSFPQDLVLVGRSTILIKGLSSRLGIPWSLCAEWAPIARKVLDKNASMDLSTTNGNINRRTVRFHDVLKVLSAWGSEKIFVVAKRLPSPIRRRWLSVLVKYQEGAVRNRRKR